MGYFNSLPTVLLSNYTEEIFIPEFAKAKNSHSFRPVSGRSHPIDCIMISGDGTTIYGLDIKAKCRRRFYNDTGFDEKDVQTYLKLPFDVYILWVCPIEQKAYGNWLSILIKHIKVEKKNAYFPLSMMIYFRDLHKEETEFILAHTNSKYY